MNTGEIVSTLEELVVRVSVLEKTIESIKSDIEALKQAASETDNTGE